VVVKMTIYKCLGKLYMGCMIKSPIPELIIHSLNIFRWSLYIHTQKSSNLSFLDHLTAYFQNLQNTILNPPIWNAISNHPKGAIQNPPIQSAISNHPKGAIQNPPIRSAISNHPI